MQRNKIDHRMAEMGHSRRFEVISCESASAPIADISLQRTNRRSVPFPDQGIAAKALRYSLAFAICEFELALRSGLPA
jgi:hypothetical protein